VVSGPRSLVLGPWSLVLSPWSSVLGPWSLVLGPWSLVLGPWSLVLGPWSLVHWPYCRSPATSPGGRPAVQRMAATLRVPGDPCRTRKAGRAGSGDPRPARWPGGRGRETRAQRARQGGRGQETRARRGRWGWGRVPGYCNAAPARGLWNPRAGVIRSWGLRRQATAMPPPSGGFGIHARSGSGPGAYAARLRQCRPHPGASEFTRGRNLVLGLTPPGYGNAAPIRGLRNSRAVGIWSWGLRRQATAMPPPPGASESTRGCDSIPGLTRLFRPFRAWICVVDVFPGRCPGLVCCGPFGAHEMISARCLRGKHFSSAGPGSATWTGRLCRAFRAASHGCRSIARGRAPNVS